MMHHWKVAGLGDGIAQHWCDCVPCARGWGAGRFPVPGGTAAARAVPMTGYGSGEG